MVALFHVDVAEGPSRWSQDSPLPSELLETRGSTGRLRLVLLDPCGGGASVPSRSARRLAVPLLRLAGWGSGWGRHA